MTFFVQISLTKQFFVSVFFDETIFSYTWCQISCKLKYIVNDIFFRSNLFDEAIFFLFIFLWRNNFFMHAVSNFMLIKTHRKRRFFVQISLTKQFFVQFFFQPHFFIKAVSNFMLIKAYRKRSFIVKISLTQQFFVHISLTKQFFHTHDIKFHGWSIL